MEESNGSLLSKSDASELKRLTKRLEARDESAVEPWCVLFRKAALISAAKILRRGRSGYCDDAESLAGEGVVVAIEISRKILDGTLILEKPANYVCSAMKNAMAATVKGDAGHEAIHQGEDVFHWVSGQSEWAIEADLSETLEDAMTVCKTPYERQLVETLAAVEDPHDAADVLNCSLRRVVDGRKRLTRHFEDRLTARGDDTSILGKAKRVSRKRQLPVESTAETL